MGRGGREKQGSKKKSSRAKGREDIASKQQGSPFRTDYNKLAALIETKGKLSALFTCNATRLRVHRKFKGGLIEGTQALDLFSMAGDFFHIQSVLGRQRRRIGSRGDAYASSLSIGFPSFAVSGEGDKGEAPNMFYPQPPSVISHLNSPFLFTSTLRATTSSPFTSKGKR
ncbi:hypothetical protein AgCh_025071 [Apium graveolens]